MQLNSQLPENFTGGEVAASIQPLQWLQVFPSEWLKASVITDLGLGNFLWPVCKTLRWKARNRIQMKKCFTKISLGFDLYIKYINAAGQTCSGLRIMCTHMFD